MTAKRAAASARTVERAIARLTDPGAALAPTPDGRGYGVYRGADRRRRPILTLTKTQVQGLLADGAIAPTPRGFELTAAGAARLRRDLAAPDEAFLSQHAPIGARAVVDADGDVRCARGLDPIASVRRLAQLRDAAGDRWLSQAELTAATRLRADWERGQVGIMPAADWTAPPASRAARGPGDAREAALARGLDARARVDAALSSLAPPLRRAITALCLEGAGLEQFERREGWPPRSAKVALKLALAQLALGP